MNNDKIDHRTSNDIFNKPINGIRECKWCHQKFENISGSQLANHVRWCKENPNRGKGLKEKLQAFQMQKMLDMYGPYKNFEVKCSNLKCSNKLVVHEREKKFPEKEHYFCSSQCAHAFSASCVNPENIKRRKLFNLNKKEKIYRQCMWCKNIFEAFVNESKKCCCNACAAKYREFILFQSKIKCAKTEYEQLKLFLKKYRQACSFTFSIKLFPDEFDFSLIEQYGWYAAKNRGNNLNGVSRDHMFSVKDGFINYIDPIFLAHPANCRLIRHNENISKLDKSLFSKTELLSRIIEWDNKYGKYNDNMNYNNFDLIYDWKKQFTII